jgi:hypothetical protein
MRDAIADAIADRVADLVATLERVGFRAPSIALGLEIAATRLRERIEQDHVAGDDNPAATALAIDEASLTVSS